MHKSKLSEINELNEDEEISRMSGGFSEERIKKRHVLRKHNKV